ncbi:hypothetical protein LTR10_015391 [Elasticomyces elasticus]|nr:hypothetical protein LTR10_015391 [Elasticomyces elasticus]
MISTTTTEVRLTRAIRVSEADSFDLTSLYADLTGPLRKAKTGNNFAVKSRSESWEVNAKPGSHK